MSIAQSLVTDFNAELELSRRVLAAVPEDKLGWRPHEKSWTLAQLAGHIAEAPSWIRSMSTDHFDMEDAGDYQPFVPESSAELLAALESNGAAPAAELADRDDAFMTATWKMSVGGKEVLSMPRAAAIRSILLHHVAHHRGQLTVYLRLLDVAVPPTYGPTADNPGGF